MDIVQELAKRNLHLILRQIFEYITYEDILECLKVNTVWREILSMALNKDQLTKLKWLHEFTIKEILYRQHFTSRNIRSMLGSWNETTRQSIFLVGNFVLFAMSDGFSADVTLLVFEGTTFKTKASIPNVMSLDWTWRYMDMQHDGNDRHAVLVAINDIGLHCWCYSLPDFNFKFFTWHSKLPKRQLGDIALLHSCNWFLGKSTNSSMTIAEEYLDVAMESFVTNTHIFKCLSGFEFGSRDMHEHGEDAILPLFAYKSIENKFICIGKQKVVLVDATQDVVLVEVECVQIDISSIQQFEDTSNFYGFNTCICYAGKFIHASINRNIIKINMQDLDNGHEVQLGPITFTDERREPHPTRFLKFASSTVPKGCLLDDRYVAICCNVTEGILNGIHVGTRVLVFAITTCKVIHDTILLLNYKFNACPISENLLFPDNWYNCPKVQLFLLIKNLLGSIS